MPDLSRPTGVDYYVADELFASGTESPGAPQPIDWLTHADQGVRFAFLKARQALMSAGHAPWFSLNYPLVKQAGLLRGPYHWLDPCQVQPPPTSDAVTAANWNNAALFPVTTPDLLDFALQQADGFCDQILAAGWGEPGDLPPGVDIEPSPYLTAGGAVAKAVLLDGGRPILEDAGHNQIGVIDVIPGPNNLLQLQGGEDVLAGNGAVIGQLRLDNTGHPDAIINAANVVLQRGRLRKDVINDLWKRVPGATPQQQQQNRIEIIVVWLAQVQRRLAAATGRQVRPVIYSATIWRELLGSPTDNGGAGWNVQHNNATFQIDNFANHPYWFANYNALNAQNQLRGFPATWATVGQLFIWQYRDDPDRNAIMRVDAVAPGSGASTRIVTLTEVDGQPGQTAEGLAWIEQIAGITRPAAPKALTRISPAPIDAAPARSFNLLLIGQGFSAAEFTAIAQRAWADPAHLHSITDTAPFGALRKRSRVACYADDGTGVFLRMRQTPSNAAGMDGALAIPPDAATVLRDYLPLLKIVADDGSETTADKVWLAQRRQVGSAGALIAILRNGRLPARNPPAAPPAAQPAELYQLDPTENYPVPVVAVNVNWNDELWPLLIVRALAQNLGGLRDEFELPGDGFDHPAVELEQSPAPNLLFIDQAARDQLAAGGAPPADLVKQALGAWRLPAGTALDFFANGAPLGAAGGVHLVEGGDGYRHQVLRSDFDCLMRRMPATVAASVPNAAGQPVRAANAPFCRVCREWLEAVLRGTQQVHAGDRIVLNSQRIAYDWVSWKTRESPAQGFDPRRAFNRVHTLNVPADEPKWSMTIAYNPAATTLADLFQISAVQLAQRPGDPYARAVDILRSLRFTDISVRYTHRDRPRAALRSEAVSLRVADALANKLDPPRLELSSEGGADRAYQLGVRLTLAWSFSGQWLDLRGGGTHTVKLFTVEAVLGLALTGEQDVDSSFPVRGCRILPQFALRVRRDSALVTTGHADPAGPAAGRVAAAVSELSGTLAIEAVNAIAPDGTLDPALASIATGRLGATLVSGSNTAMGDSAIEPTVNDLLLPSSGRKLAGMHVNHAIPFSVNRPFVFGPPAWSWRYDYVRSLLAARTAVAGAFRDNEPKGATSPPAARDRSVTWPAGSAFQIGVHKYPRQGDYDALFIHPVDATASPALAIPICGDLGLALVVRQGASEGANTLGLPLLGWGPGQIDSGAHTSVGAPLAPPNQHVDLTIETPAQGVVRVTYATIAQEFRDNDWQVFCEQGLALGYRYNVRNPAGLQWLRSVAAMMGVPAATIQALNAALADTAHPAALDIQVRALFRELHARARFYDQQVDGSVAQQAPEAKDAPGVETL